jgi:adenine-specific DNA-methyltransferase
MEDKIENKFGIESRRYIGNKSKLTDWIMNIIQEETSGAGMFCDIFAGTGSIAKKALDLFDKVIINDFLYSNNVIYKAFMMPGEWSVEKLNWIVSAYNKKPINEIKDNWFSRNYGNKFFDNNVAKQIGFIRQDIEDNKKKLSDKEYNILLTTLIYNIDRLANTVGHYEAYIKKPIARKNLILKPIDAKSYTNVDIHREDANKLARNLHADIVYIDPPYNSRQYSRFYHIYETLIKWDKPKLYGVALKPVAENMSEYCRSKALDAFKDLVFHLDTRYIVVSYNNTYNSKSHSSINKISLDDIKNTLQKIGKTKIFTHDYQAFNAGKTDLNGHKEYLFVTTVYKR